jgi:tripartite-type tricarboxylate transporter receptor subunit TctC
MRHFKLPGSRMGLLRKNGLRLLAAMCTACLAIGASAADHYPGKPIVLVVPSVPGGSADKLGRLLGDKVGKSLGQPVVLDFKPGASGLVAEEAVVKSAPDGHTVLLDQSTITMNPVLLKSRMRFDLLKDLRPVSNLVRFQQMLVVSTALPVRSVQELVAYAKAGGSLNYSTMGSGTPQHVLSEQFLRSSGITATHVPYKGGAAALLAVASGDVQFNFLSVSTGQGMAQSGRVRALGVLDGKRASKLPDVPTFEELGYRDMASSWLGIFVARNTPEAIVQRLHQEFGKALQDPQVRETLAEGGMQPIGNTPAEFMRQVADEIAFNRKLVQEFQISVD